MHKNLFKIGALALGMFAFGMMFYTNAQSAENGTVSLSIKTGQSVCTFGSFDLGAYDMAFDESLTVSGGNQTWECRDLQGGVKAWTYTIQAEDLTGSNGGIISSSNVSLKHDTAVITGGDSACSASSNEDYREIGGATAETLIERTAIGNGALCSVALPNVMVQVEIPANQTPGEYVGDIVLTSSEGFDIDQL